jgi:hypothetical protein
MDGKVAKSARPGMLVRVPRATGNRRSTWLAVDKGWLK